MLCEISDFTFPLLADVYYPIVTQGDLGEVKKQWLIDKTIACSLSYAGLKAKEEVNPNPIIKRTTPINMRGSERILFSPMTFAIMASLVVPVEPYIKVIP